VHTCKFTAVDSVRAVYYDGEDLRWNVDGMEDGSSESGVVKQLRIQATPGAVLALATETCRDDRQHCRRRRNVFGSPGGARSGTGSLEGGGLYLKCDICGSGCWALTAENGGSARVFSAHTAMDSELQDINGTLWYQNAFFDKSWPTATADRDLVYDKLGNEAEIELRSYTNGVWSGPWNTSTCHSSADIAATNSNCSVRFNFFRITLPGNETNGVPMDCENRASLLNEDVQSSFWYEYLDISHLFYGGMAVFLRTSLLSAFGYTTRIYLSLLALYGRGRPLQAGLASSSVRRMAELSA
jgi:hypothetical protein